MTIGESDRKGDDTIRADIEVEDGIVERELRIDGIVGEDGVGRTYGDAGYIIGAIDEIETGDDFGRGIQRDVTGRTIETTRLIQGGVGCQDGHLRGSADDDGLYVRETVALIPCKVSQRIVGRHNVLGMEYVVRE